MAGKKGFPRKSAGPGKAARATPQGSQEQFRNPAEVAGSGIAAFDTEGNITFISDRLCRLLGYAAEEVLGRHFADFVHRDDSPLLMEALITAVDGDAQSEALEFRLIRRDGQIVWFRTNPEAVIVDGRVSGFNAGIYDITERKQLEEELVKSEQRYRTILDQMQDTYHELDLAGRFTFVSESATRSYGYSREDLIGQSYRLVTPQEDIKGAAAAFNEVYRTGIPNKGFSHRIRHKDGSITFSEASIDLHRDAQGEVNGFKVVNRDITARRMMEEALRDSEERFRRLAEHAPDVIYRYNLKPARGFEYVSPAAVKICGYRPDEFYNDPLLALRIVHPQDRELYRRHFLELASVGATIVLRWIHKDGHITWAEEIDVPVYDDGGELISYEGIVRDITERKLSELTLRRSEAQYRLLSEHMTDFIWLMDMELNPTYQSPSAEKITGFTQQEMKDLPFEKRIAPASLKLAAEMFFEEIPRVLADPEYNPVRILELEVCRKDGTTVWSENKFSIIRDESGRAVSILGEARDITDSKRSEAALKASLSLLSASLESTADGILIVDGDGKIARWNRKFADMWQIPQEVLTSYNDEKTIEYILGQLADPQGFLARVKELYSRPEESSFDQVEFIDGRIFERYSQPQKIEGDIVGRVWSFRDITDRRHMEEEVRRVEKLESVGLLAGGIAHDFNNILTAILGNISLARVEAAPGSELQVSLEQAEKAALRAKDLTQQLLTFSKGGAPVTKLTSLAELIRETVGFALHGSTVKCRFSIQEDLWNAEIDPGQVSQVIHNLVINAQQAMPAGGNMEVRAGNVAIDLLQSLGRGLPLEPGNYVRIAVADHGSGIPAEHLDRVFDPFFSTKQAGSGLGLATSFAIARNHGGHLSVESEVGSGSTFYLYLRASLDTITTGLDSKETLKPAAGARILVMDDEKGVREVAGRMLRHIGYENVEFAADGAEAVKLYQAARDSGRPFSAAILDLTVPGGMGGRETITKLLKIDPDVKAVVSSGYAEGSVMADYRAYGFSGMVAKPYTLEQLGKALNDVIGL